MDVAEVNQWCWLKKSGQWLENVDRTHLVQGRVKPVLQKIELFLYAAPNQVCVCHCQHG